MYTFFLENNNNNNNNNNNSFILSFQVHSRNFHCNLSHNIYERMGTRA